MYGMLGEKAVKFSDLVRLAAEDAYLSLKTLVDKSANSDEQSDSEKKIDLLKFIAKTRQRMLRIHAVAEWCQQVPLVDRCQQIAATLANHDASFTQTADSLFYMHEGLQQACAPMFDVPSAIEVFLTGGYQRLPKCIEDLGAPAFLTDDQQKHALVKLGTLLRYKLLETSVPEAISDISVSNGVATLRVNGEFKILLTLGYHGHLSMWRVLHLEFLVGDKSGFVKLEESRKLALGNDLERRMAQAENPLITLYTILHELCISLVMDIVTTQVQALCQGIWKDAIRFVKDDRAGLGENASVMQPAQDGKLEVTGQKRLGFKIIYWVDLDRNVGGFGSCPFLRIESGQDMQLKCLHEPFVLDPLTDTEAEFSVDQSCIDVEKLLFKAIACNKHTHLLGILSDLRNNFQNFQASGDVILQRDGDDSTEKKDSKPSVEGHCGDEVLQVSAHGGSYIIIGINIRNGRFLLKSSENILPQSALSDYEEALNLGRLSAAEILISLRRKSILHLFVSPGRFLGLQVYEECLATLEIPKSILHGPDMLLMRFPQCGGSYYLLIQLDEDFKLVLNLVETRPGPGRKSQSISVSDHVIRFWKIDLGQMQMNVNEKNSSPHYLEKLQCASSIGEEDPLNLHECSQSSFSSIVDEVFKFQKGASNSSPIQDHISLSSNMSPRSSSTLLNAKGSLKSSHVSETGQFSVKDENPARQSSDIQLTQLSQLGTNSPIHDSSIVPDGLKNSVANDVPTQERTSVKRIISDMQMMIPAFRGSEANSRLRKKRKSSESSQNDPSGSETPLSAFSCIAGGYIDRGQLVEVTKDIHPSNMYVPSLLNFVRHCLLCIKHAQLSSQMDALDIPYVKELGGPTKILAPFAWNESHQNVYFLPDKPGSMAWDVKANDPHFKEIWELQNGSTSTWGCDVCIVSASDSDSHINCDSDGVVLSYKSVEADSIQRLVSDLRRLFKARKFARQMRKLIGMKADNKLDNVSSDAHNKLVQQMRTNFKIEGVGLMSLWFSYDSVYFVVEWENGKEGSTIHVSPDHLWTHTKFLEDLINEDQVASFLDCVMLTTGPLLALAAALPPAPLEPNASPSSTIRPASSATLGTITAPLGSRNFRCSLLPCDIIVVLKQLYWIRIIYREKFALDMRCFAGDHVWIQPATLPEGGPADELQSSFFQPFIMDYVVQCHMNGDDTHPEAHMNRDCTGFGDYASCGGRWVHLTALKDVLRGIFKYLGALWLFAQLPALLTEILCSTLNNKPRINVLWEKLCLGFIVGCQAFAVSVNETQLVLRVFIHKGSPPQQTQTNAHEELSTGEISLLCNYFCRNVTSEPYEASRVASFITLLTLPIPILREFLQLISWFREMPQRTCIELCLENSATFRSNIHHDHARKSVDFALNFVSGAAGIPNCVSVRLGYLYGENNRLVFRGMDGRACWLQKCKERMAKTVEYVNELAVGDNSQGRLTLVAEHLQRTLHATLPPTEKPILVKM